MSIEDAMSLTPLHEYDPTKDPIMEFGFEEYVACALAENWDGMTAVAKALAGIDLVRGEAEATAPWN
jgi:hypothetical protein